MVSATIAEVTRYGVNIKGPDGRTIASRSARLADPSWEHGINLDEGDELVEQLGYLPGTFRWQEKGGFYKAVVLPEAQMRARWPEPKVESADVVRLKNIHAIGHPEGMAGLRREGSVSKAEITAARAELRRRGLRS